jgi:K+-sensing histidine kinase KdpD
MIKKLQIKFIIITMLATIIVIGGIYSVIIIENYRTTNRQIDELLNLIVENDGTMPEYKERKDEFADFITKETQYSTRYFTIKINNSNEIIETDMKSIVSVTQEDTEKILTTILKDNKTSGYYENYKYKIVQKSDKKLIVFLDCTTQLNNLKSTTQKSLIIIAIGLVIVFIIVSVLSKKILKPLVQSLEKQKQFITNASHELKTPLAVITADIDVLEMTMGEDNEWINSIKKQTNSLDTLIKSLLNLANIEERKNKLELVEFSITNVINEEIQEFKSLLKNKHINFDSSKDVAMVGDINSIKQLIAILLDNSIKYTPDEGVIEISAERYGKGTKIEIANTCENAKNINTKKLFDRFYRDDKSRNKKKEGYGIGLSIAKSIVDLHKGKITVEVNKKEMICFKIII